MPSKLNLRKAGGQDGIVSEHLKFVPEFKGIHYKKETTVVLH